MVEPSIPVPEELPALLQQLAKAILKEQPADLVAFGAQYFARLQEQRAAERPPPAKLKVILSGAPACGKGTQAARVVEKYGLVHISVGDLLRAEVAAGSETGLAAHQFIDSGELVPDELVVGMVKARLGQPDVQARGWLLDGYPRSEAQAEALVAGGVTPDLFLLIQVPDEVLVDRVAWRRSDPETGEIYHLAFKPPPPDVLASGRLVQRSDDTEEKVRMRLAAYHTQTAAVVGRYADCLVEVDGNRDMAHVWADVDAALGKRQAEVALTGAGAGAGAVAAATP